MAIVRFAGKYGLIDQEGNEVVEPKYTIMYEFNRGLAKVIISGKCGSIDENGNEVVKPGNQH